MQRFPLQDMSSVPDLRPRHDSVTYLETQWPEEGRLTATGYYAWCGLERLYEKQGT